MATTSSSRPMLPTCNAYTGAVNLWVKIPTVSHGTVTVFYMFYGNSSIATDQSNTTAVWDNSYAGVWHLWDSVANTTVQDSTSHGNNGQPRPTQTPGP